MADSYNEKGALGHSTSGSKGLDFFTKVVRNSSPDEYIPLFVDSWNEDPTTCLKIIMNLRDIRSGKGEKKIPIILLFCIKLVKYEIYCVMVKQIVETLGCWKDLLHICEYTVLYNKPDINNDYELNLFADQITKDQCSLADYPDDPISLAAKWAPSEKTYYNKKELMLANKLANVMELSPKNYRKILVQLRSKIKIVETYMAQNRWDLIKFEAIPSKAHLNYRKSFLRDTNSKDIQSTERANLNDRYKKYLVDLKNGDKKVNTTGIQPHELVSKYLKCKAKQCELVEAQWNTIVSKTKEFGTFEKTMAIVDVSMSMSGTPMDVAISLGILLASITSEPFNNKMITFSEDPQWHTMDSKHSLYQKVKSVSKMVWGMNTNIEKVFILILDLAKSFGLAQSRMIETLFIFTDMQFDQCSNNSTNMKYIKEMYITAGYNIPKIIFWNLRSVDVLPIQQHDENVGMLSGFSEQLLKAVLEGKNITPFNLMNTTIDKYVPNINGSGIINITSDVISLF